jgi:hypothetical protein
VKGIMNPIVEKIKECAEPVERLTAFREIELASHALRVLIGEHAPDCLNTAEAQRFVGHAVELAKYAIESSGKYKMIFSCVQE